MKINILLAQLEVDDYRLQAIQEITLQKSVQALPALIRLLYSEKNVDFNIKKEAVYALIQIADLSIIPVFGELLRTTSPSSEKDFDTYIIALIDGLGIFNGEDYSNTIIPYLSHEVESIRMAALRTLELFKWTPDHIQNKIRWLAAKGDWEEISKSGKASVKPLIALTQDFNIFGCKKIS